MCCGMCEGQNLPASSVRRRRLQPRMSPNPGAEQAGSPQRAPTRLSLPTPRAARPTLAPPRTPRPTPPFLHTVRDPPTQPATASSEVCVGREEEHRGGNQGSRNPASTPLRYPSTLSLSAYLSCHPLSLFRVPPAPAARSRISEQVQFGFPLNPLLSLLVPQQRFQP